MITFWRCSRYRRDFNLWSSKDHSQGALIINGFDHQASYYYYVNLLQIWSQNFLKDYLSLLDRGLCSVFFCIQIAAGWKSQYFFFHFFINPSEAAESLFCLLASDDPGLLRFELVHCLHLFKSSVNGILLYVPGSDYKCKMTWPELFVPLLWGRIPPFIVPSRLKMSVLGVGGKIINNSHGSLHPRRFPLQINSTMEDKKADKTPAISVCLLSLRCSGERITERGTIECKSAHILPDFSAQVALHAPAPPPNTTPPPPWPHPPWGKTSRNLLQIRRCHIKNGVTEKAVMAGKDVAAVWASPLGSMQGPPRLLGLYAIRGSCTPARHVEVGFDLDGFMTV